MKISYLVTCSTETTTLERLLRKLEIVVPSKEEEVVVVADTDTRNENTDKILNSFSDKFRIMYHSLEKNYGAHKNWGAEQCVGDWIFQIDGDEIPSEYTLGENLQNIISVNPGIELLFVPRINDFKGVGPEHAAQWGWRLTEMEFFRPSENQRVKAPVVNAPDYQSRIYKNEPSRIRWDRRLHEKIEGHESMSKLPDDEAFALYHDKTIEKQLETNKRYNVWFTQEENKGHDVFSPKK